MAQLVSQLICAGVVLASAAGVVRVVFVTDRSAVCGVLVADGAPQ